MNIKMIVYNFNIYINKYLLDYNIEISDSGICENVIFYMILPKIRYCDYYEFDYQYININDYNIWLSFAYGYYNTYYTLDIDYYGRTLFCDYVLWDEEEICYIILKYISS